MLAPIKQKIKQNKQKKKKIIIIVLLISQHVSLANPPDHQPKQKNDKQNLFD